MSVYSSNHSSVHLFTLQLPALAACLRRSSFLSKATWTLALGSFKLFLPSPSPPHRGESCLFRQTTASLLGGGMGLSAQDVVTAEVTGHFCPLPVPSSQLPRLESRWPYKPWLRGSVRRVKETLGTPSMWRVHTSPAAVLHHVRKMGARPKGSNNLFQPGPPRGADSHLSRSAPKGDPGPQPMPGEW